MFNKVGRRPSHAGNYAMCFDPASLAIMATVATAVSTVVSTVGNIQQGNAARAQANLQAQVSEQQAAASANQSAADERDFRRNQSAAMASRRAALGGAGVDQATGSPLFASEDFAGEAELQALRIRSGGNIRSTRLQQQATLQRFSGKQAQTSGFLRAGASLLSGGGKTFDQFSRI